jgi:hypothetical protein
VRKNEIVVMSGHVNNVDTVTRVYVNVSRCVCFLRLSRKLHAFWMEVYIFHMECVFFIFSKFYLQLFST